jgi:hypothetical protein
MSKKACYGKFEAKASPFRAGMKPTNSIQPPTMVPESWRLTDSPLAAPLNGGDGL